MSGSKLYLPIALTSLLVSPAGSAIADTSALDPYAFVQPTRSKISADAATGETILSKPSMEGDSTKSFMPKANKPVKVADKSEKSSKFGLPGFGGKHHEKHDAPKVAHIEKTERAERDQERSSNYSHSVLDGGGKSGPGVGSELANGAKSSGNFFLKGAKAIGSGFKKSTESVEKVAHSSKKSLPGLNGDDKNEIAYKESRPEQTPTVTKTVANKAGAPAAKMTFGQIDGNTPDFPDSNQHANQPATLASNAPNRSSGAPQMALPSAKSKGNSSGLLGKTFGKLPFMGGGNDAPKLASPPQYHKGKNM